jgi:CDP-diacylglycerol pyrophosphatase
MRILGPLAAMIGLGLLAVVAGSSAWIGASSAQAANPNALWHIVHDLCVPDFKATGAPAPCTAVDLNQGYAVLNDIRGATQLLILPTDRISGIESGELLSPGSHNYWQAAWQARRYFEKRVGRAVPREDIGLAINSIYARSQNQLHIHLDCVRPDVLRVLQANEGKIGAHWSRLNVALAGHRYRVRRLEGAELGSRDPFKMLAGSDRQARADMGREALVVVGAVFAGGRPGFVVLADSADLATLDAAAGEDLLDHRCTVLTVHRSRAAPRPSPRIG